MARVMRSICRLPFSISSPAFAASSRACVALAALRRTWPEMSEMVWDSSSMEPACSVAPSARACAAPETWPALAATCPAEFRNAANVRFMDRRMRRMDPRMGARSPLYSRTAPKLRSPSDIRVRWPVMSAVIPCRLRSVWAVACARTPVSSPERTSGTGVCRSPSARRPSRPVTFFRLAEMEFENHTT